MSTPPAGRPRLARLLLALSIRPRDRRFALADLDEEFDERVIVDGLAAARSWYRGQALRSLGPSLRARFGIARGYRGREQTEHTMGDAGMRQRWGNHGHNVISDLRQGFRSLRKSPAAVIVTVLSLGVGIGAVTAAFAVTNSLLLRAPTGLLEPERLVSLYTSEDDGDLYGSSSWADFTDMVAELDALDDAALMAIRSINLVGPDLARSLFAEEVSGNYFDVTGIRPILGRAFLPEEGRIGTPRSVAVLGHDLWTHQFGSDAGIVGETIRLNGLEFTVIGVAPDGVTSRRVPLEPDVWVPLGSADALAAANPETAGRDARRFGVFGRLAAEATAEQLQTQAAVLSERLSQEYSESWLDARNTARTITVVSERASRGRPDLRALLGGIGSFLVGIAILILLIACSNVTSLFLARASQRNREFAVRASLGAGRSRLVAMLMTEALIPGVAAGIVGVLVAVWTVGLINNAALPVNLPIRPQVDLDSRVIAFAALASIGASLVFGLIPALRGSQPTLTPALKGDPPIFRKRGAGIRSLLVVGQCAASLVLVVGATLFVRALGSATDTKLGIDPTRIAVATKALDPQVYGPEEGLQYFRELRERVRAKPGVEDVQLSRSLELTLLMVGAAVDLTVDGRSPAPHDEEVYFRNSVTPGYLEMMRIDVLRGRSLQESDGPGAPLVAVVNEDLAQRFWPGEEALGKRFAMVDLGGADGVSEADRTVEVVGIAVDGKYGDFDEGPTPYFWTSLYQDYAPKVAVSVRGAQSAESMIPVLRETIELDHGEVQVVPASTLASQLSIQFIHLRIASRILAWGGLFGLFLAVIGIYGIVSFAVTQRTREMAVRMAIGAEQGQVVRSIVGDGVKLAVGGLVVGLMIAVPAAHVLGAVLAGISPLDPLAYGSGLGLLLAAALLASLVPARRATRIAPMRVLREE